MGQFLVLAAFQFCDLTSDSSEDDVTILTSDAGRLNSFSQHGQVTTIGRMICRLVIRAIKRLRIWGNIGKPIEGSIAVAT